MSRERLPRAENDLYARHPLRIIRALKTGELDPLRYLILKFLVDEIEAPGRGSEAIYTLEELGRLIGWSRSGEWLRQNLHALRAAGWIDFEEPRPGPNAAWIIRLTGAAIDGERDESPTNLQLQTPSELEINSKGQRDSQLENPLLDGLSAPLESPTAGSPRAEQSGENLPEENEDHVLGKTTAESEDNAGRLLNEEDLAELGTLPLGDLHRRHERGEL